MTYELYCDDCDEKVTIEASMQDGPGYPKCPKCGKPMHQDFKKIAIRIPEYMQAGTDAVSPTAIGNRMNRSRPSGKRRSLHAVGGIQG